VPNPIISWPFSVLGEHTLQELIDEVFTFHLVPAPEASYTTSAGFWSLCRWQIAECGARFCVLMVAWAACLVTICRIDMRLKPVNKSRQPSTTVPMG